MKSIEPYPFADPDAAARKLVEITNSVEAVQDGRVYIERVNEPFLAAGGSGERFHAGIERAIALGWIWRHESGTYLCEIHRQRRSAVYLSGDSGCKGTLRWISAVAQFINRMNSSLEKYNWLRRTSPSIRAGVDATDVN